MLSCRFREIRRDMSKIATISVLNLKGGCGKSSLIVNLGGVLKENGRRPLLIDLDPQRSASEWAAQGGERFPFPIVDLSVGKDVKRFKASLDSLIAKHKADTLLIDTAPSLADQALVSALLSDIVLVPASPSPLDLWAAEKAITTIREAQQERKGPPKIILVPSRLSPGTILAREIGGALEHFNEKISPPIFMRVAIPEACVDGTTIDRYAPKSASHKEFKNLMKFVNSNLRK